MDGKPIFLSEWFENGILSIDDLLNDSGNFLTFHVFRKNIPVNPIFYSIIKLLALRL